MFFKITRIKNYWKKKKLCSKNILCYRFCANLPLVKTAQDVEAEMELCTLPYPYKLETAWMEEKDGITC